MVHWKNIQQCKVPLYIATRVSCNILYVRHLNHSLPCPVKLWRGSKLVLCRSMVSSFPPSAEEVREKEQSDWARGGGVGPAWVRSSRYTNCASSNQVLVCKTPKRVLAHRPSTLFRRDRDLPLTVAKCETEGSFHFFLFPITNPKVSPMCTKWQ